MGEKPDLIRQRDLYSKTEIGRVQFYFVRVFHFNEITHKAAILRELTSLLSR